MELLSRLCFSFVVLTISVAAVKPVLGQYSGVPSLYSTRLEINRQRLEEKRRQTIRLQLQELETDNSSRPDRSLRTDGQYTISVTQMNVPKKSPGNAATSLRY